MRYVLTTWIVGCLAASCTTVPKVGEVLTPQHATQASKSEALVRADEKVRLALARVKASEGAPDGAAEAHIAAARALAVAADVRLLSDQVKREQAAGLDLDALVNLDDTADEALKSAVRGLCSEGLAHADAALNLVPGNLEALSYRAFNLSLVAWAEGSATALLYGRGPALDELTQFLAQELPDFHAAMSLRMRGRFLDRAPWPYADTKDAIALLREAVRRAPAPVNWQFLGDAFWSSGDQAAAREAWQAGSQASSFPATEYGAPARKALNRARLRRLPDNSR